MKTTRRLLLDAADLLLAQMTDRGTHPDVRQAIALAGERGKYANSTIARAERNLYLKFGNPDGTLRSFGKRQSLGRAQRQEERGGGSSSASRSRTQAVKKLSIALLIAASAASASEKQCLTMAIYREARGESRIGQDAVAHVVLNRVRESNTSACAVIAAPGQFPWYNKHKKFPNKKAWSKSEVVAEDALVGRSKDPTNGAKFFASPACRGRATLRIGKHRFCK